MISELSRREKIAGIKPDDDLDIFMKVLSIFFSLQIDDFCLEILTVTIISFSHLLWREERQALWWNTS